MNRAVVSIRAAILMAIGVSPVVLGQIKNTVELVGPLKPVRIVIDRQGVPHIQAASLRDAYYALGYMHSHDRRMQMELLRRFARGRSAEIFGESSLPADRLMRTFGVEHAAKAEISLLSEDEKAIHEAYASGVNAAAEQLNWRQSMLGRILKLHGEPWAMLDSLSILKINAVLIGNYQEELLQAAIMREVGPDILKHLFPSDYDPRALPLFRRPALYEPNRRRTSELERIIAAIRLDWSRLVLVSSELPIGSPLGVGSNSWVIHGSRTSTGLPILATDPHMAPTAPSGIYSAHLISPETEVYGVGIPGTLAFFHGHNGHIAWGITVAGTDTQDTYLEELSTDEPVRVRTPSGWANLQVEEENIHVAGKSAPIKYAVRRSRHGPLLSDATPGVIDGAMTTLPSKADSTRRFGVALATTALKPSSPRWYLKLIRSTNWTEFRAALREYSGPGYNFIYADTRGNIGYQLAARVPLRQGPPPEAPIPGWLPGRDWKGEAEFDSLPSLQNPAAGFIVTANARIVPTNYPLYLSTRWGDVAWRVNRIQTLIQGFRSVSVEAASQMQLDIYQGSKRQVAAWIQSAQPEDERLVQLKRQLASWDLRAAKDSIEQAVADAFVVTLLEEVFGPHLSRALLDAYTAKPMFWTAALEQAVEDPTAAFFGSEPQAAVKKRSVAITSAFQKAVSLLDGRFGRNPEAWTWSKVHTVTFASPFAQGTLAFLRGAFNVGPFSAGGSNDTLNLAFWAKSNLFSVVYCPGYRQVINLANLDDSLYLPPPPGQSETPGSSFYSNLAPHLYNGVYYLMRMPSGDEVAQTISLVPKAA